MCMVPDTCVFVIYCVHAVVLCDMCITCVVSVGMIGIVPAAGTLVRGVAWMSKPALGSHCCSSTRGGVHCPSSAMMAATCGRTPRLAASNGLSRTHGVAPSACCNRQDACDCCGRVAQYAWVVIVCTYSECVGVWVILWQGLDGQKPGNMPRGRSVITVCADQQQRAMHGLCMSDTRVV